MRISLTNFKCHENGRFDIPDEGLILLSGESGAGKSTILSAFYHALYGKIKKPYSHGKKTSKVELEYKDLKIVRSSNPGRLMVFYKNKQYEDDSAQGVIDRVLGMNHTEFLASSYIIQNKDVSVLTMTPSEQVEFIQNLSFSSVDQVDSIKERIREKSRDIDDEKRQVESNISLLNSQLEDIRQTLSEDFEYADDEQMSADEIRGKLTELNNQLQATNKKIENRTKQLADCKDLQTKNKESEDEIAKINLELTFLKDKIDSLQATLSSLNKEELEKEHNAVQNAISYQSFVENIEEQENNYKNMRTDLENETKQKLEDLKQKVLSDEKILEIKNLVKSLKEKLNLYSKFEEKEKFARNLVNIKLWVKELFGFGDCDVDELIAFLENERNSIAKEIGWLTVDNFIGNITNVKCPECFSCLNLYKDCLFKQNEERANEERAVGENVGDETRNANILAFNTIQDKIIDLRQIQNLLSLEEPEISSSECIKQIEKNERNILKNEYIKEEINSLTELISSGDYQDTFSMKTLKDKISGLKNKLEKLNTGELNLEGKNKSVKELKNKTHEIVNQLEKVKSITNEYNKLVADYNNLENKKKSLKASLVINSDKKQNTFVPNEIEKEIEQLRADLMNINEEIVAQREELDYALVYEKEQAKYKQMDRIQSMIKTKEDQVQKLSSRLIGFIGLEKACKEAEILSLEKIISSINEHAKFYLEKMFTEEIIVRLESVKTTNNGKSSKLQINTYLEYKDQVYDSINELSGGEKQRCELAFLLAVNDIVGSKVLMLDECLNNLDAHINTEVLTFLRELCEDKMLLVVSHEAVKGVFDHEIEI